MNLIPQLDLEKVKDWDLEISPDIRLSDDVKEELLLDESGEEPEDTGANAIDLMAFLDEPQESEAGDESHVDQSDTGLEARGRTSSDSSSLT